MGYRLRVWDEQALRRLAAAWRDGVTPRELAERVDYTERAIRWKLAQLRKREDRDRLLAALKRDGSPETRQ
jgi:hypothetical protein